MQGWRTHLHQSRERRIRQALVSRPPRGERERLGVLHVGFFPLKTEIIEKNASKRDNANARVLALLEAEEASEEELVVPEKIC